MNVFKRYSHWLHEMWPSGTVEKLPVVNEDGSTNVTGLYVAGDLRGIPLLKFAADSGARVISTIAADLGKGGPGDGVDVAIIGGGVAGMAAALECRKLGLTYTVFEANEPFSTITNFPKGKPIYTYPREMTPEGSLTVSADVKEALVDELTAQTTEGADGIETVHAHVDRVEHRGDGFDIVVPGEDPVRAKRVVCALGRSGNYRRLGVPGEDLEKVYNRLHDPQDFCGQNVLVVGGGDSALETAVALAECGSKVTVSYRKESFSRPKPENIEALERLTGDGGNVRLKMQTSVTGIRDGGVDLQGGSGAESIDNDVVFAMIGREPPLDFFRRSGVTIGGEWNKNRLFGFLGFVLFCTLLYNWKSGGFLSNLTYSNNWWPVSIKDAFSGVLADPASLLSVIVTSASTPSFWYTLAYSLLVVIFGFRRIKRRNTPYVTVQTSVLMAIQVLPLFILPEILLPWLGKNALLPQGFLDALFPAVEYGNGREYWRAYGLILAWPLNVYNVFTGQPLGWWLTISFVQTFVLIPFIIYYWGKGAYCGWICSCGALAETLGDTHRTKMVHGAQWNRANSFGQIVLAVAVLMLVWRVVGWTQPADAAINRFFPLALDRYKWIVDVFLAGIVGYGFYFWYSGRVWCRFMCPLAALMHIYARFSRFRILADKKKCISCNVCTSVCHQGIDIMSFANKGEPMADPECVRCSACVQSCPTGVLTFGQVNKAGDVVATDRLSASPVQAREG